MGIIGCILAAIHVVISLPFVVAAANRQFNPVHFRKIYLVSGLLMYSAWASFGYMNEAYLLMFAMGLGLLKYSVVLIQLWVSYTVQLIKK